MATGAKQLTDQEFHQNIIDLCKGTHWTQGKLKTYCLVSDPPEHGATKLVKEGNYNADAGAYGPGWKKSQWCLVGMVFRVGGLYEDGEDEGDEVNLPKPISDMSPEATVAYSLTNGESEFVSDQEQIARIINQLWEQLPSEHQSARKYQYDDERIEWGTVWNPDTFQTETVYMTREQMELMNKTDDIEGWNDQGDPDEKKRGEVIALCERARDSVSA